MKEKSRVDLRAQNELQLPVPGTKAETTCFGGRAVILAQLAGWILCPWERVCQGAASHENRQQPSKETAALSSYFPICIVLLILGQRPARVTTQRDCPLGVHHQHAYHQPHPELHSFPGLKRLQFHECSFSMSFCGRECMALIRIVFIQ